MEKATLHLKGQIAEVLENKGKLHATIVCDTDHLLISLDNMEQMELGSDVNLELELRVKSIQIE